MHAPLIQALPESVYYPAQALVLLGQAWRPASVYLESVYLGLAHLGLVHLGLAHPALVLRARVARARVLIVAVQRIGPVLDNTSGWC